jgi:hypothetical protein
MLFTETMKNRQTYSFVHIYLNVNMKKKNSKGSIGHMLPLWKVRNQEAINKVIGILLVSSIQ